MAPFAPFFTEIIYQNLVTDSKESIHLELLPQVKESRILPQLETGMKEVQIAVEKIHAARKAAGIRVRQPLRSVTITSSKSPNSNLQDLLAQEVNVKKVIWQQGDQLDVKLDTHLTAKLLAEGQARELIRQIQDARKNAGTLIDEGIDLELPDWPPAFETEIKAKVLARNLTQGETLKIIRLNA
jgi:isoleucyl-tRNA synthetase